MLSWFPAASGALPRDAAFFLLTGIFSKELLTPARRAKRAEYNGRRMQNKDGANEVPDRRADSRLSNIHWEPRAQSFVESLRAVLAPPPADFDPAAAEASSWRSSFTEGRIPRGSIAASVASHILIAGLLLLPLGHPLEAKAPRTRASYERTVLYAPRDLQAITPSGRAPLAAPPRSESATPTPAPRGADAFHPRQTIASLPERWTHPRQTLIRPDAPSAPPKISPQLPNIAEWAGSPSIPAPRLQFAAATIKVRRRVNSAPEIAAPDMKATAPANINFGPSAPASPLPALAVNANIAPSARRRTLQADAPPEQNTQDIAPAISGDSAGLKQLIAISADPAPPAPPRELPNGNLSARVMISPDGSRPGVPGGLPDAPHSISARAAGAHAADAGAPNGSGPAGISITGNRIADPGALANASSGGAVPDPRHAAASRTAPSHSAAGRTIGNWDPSVPPERILRDAHIGTLHVNMPNLTSASGSWTLRFARLDDGTAPKLAYTPQREVNPPVPLRKVDPRYPPELVKERIEGEVVLYAIIRKDGSIDSIQVMRSIDPQLDRNAMDALAHWKFGPGTLDGEPVDVEAVVHIPFRAPALP
jgi:protein TonB